MPSLTPITVSADTYIIDSDPTNNFSTSTEVRIYQSSGKFVAENRGLLQFDLSSLPPNAVVTEALLTVYGSAIGGTTGGVRVARVTQDVVISQATWNQYSTGNNWTTGGGDFTLDNAVTVDRQDLSFDIDIAGIVQDAADLELTTLNLILYQPVSPPSYAWHIAAIEDPSDPEATLTITYALPSDTTYNHVRGSIKNPVLIGVQTATPGWVQLHGDLPLVKGVRISNADSSPIQINYGGNSDDLNEEGYYLLGGKNVFIATPNLNRIFIKGGGTASFIAQ